jgi:low affinity Fe/Cu permease
MSISAAFGRAADTVAKATGQPATFVSSCACILVWAATGPLFKFSDTWQLVINTGTTIVTFLMVFLIQNTQNRDAQAIHLKLDELIRCVEGARTGMVDLEDLSDEELKRLQSQFQQLREHLDGPDALPEAEKVEEELSERTAKPSERRPRHAA